MQIRADVVRPWTMQCVCVAADMVDICWLLNDNALIFNLVTVTKLF